MPKLTATDAAYVAGFIDGEGCISYERYKQDGKFYHRATVIVSNTNQEVLEWICLAVGSGKVRSTKKKPGHKQQYLVRWACNQAVELLQQVLPFLKVKGTRAKLILDVVSATSEYEGLRIPANFVVERQKAHLAIKALNQRGDQNAIN